MATTILAPIYLEKVVHSAQERQMIVAYIYGKLLNIHEFRRYYSKTVRIYSYSRDNYVPLLLLKNRIDLL